MSNRICLAPVARLVIESLSAACGAAVRRSNDSTLAMLQNVLVCVGEGNIDAAIDYLTRYSEREKEGK